MHLERERERKGKKVRKINEKERKQGR